MKLTYQNKIEENDILALREQKNFKGNKSLLNIKKELNRLLFEGDNFEIMKSLIDTHKLAGTVDLVYIDPPFSTNTIFRIDDARVSTISSSVQDRIAYTDTLKGAEFLEFLRQRLILIRELMSDKASIYLHIDYKVGHYVKIIMDEVFGPENFRNDITRIKCNPKNFQRKGYGNIKDLILFYTKTDNFTWNEPMEEREDEEISRLFNKVDEQGRRYTTNPLHAPGETTNGKTGKEWKGIKPPKGRHWRYGPDVLDELEKQGLIEWSKNGVPRKRIYADDYQKKRVQDIWEYKDKPNPIYPTEKNLELLERIIKTSSNEGDLVMDCFCGSGGLLYTAEEMKRRWLGIDASKEAISVTLNRFKKKENSLFSNIEINKLSL
jgi:adenine-specific DNA-methyltransferase